MQKTVRISMFLLYALFTVGVHVHAHECCCSSETEVALAYPDHSCCSDDYEACCEDHCEQESAFDFKLDEEHVAGEKLLVRLTIVNVQLVIEGPCSESLVADNKVFPREGRAPPDIKKYELFCARITYG
jgi:hypothetical protein